MTESGQANLLVVPFNVANPKTGAGQRTRLMFEALSGLGPVDVVLLYPEQAGGDGSWLAEFFPDARHFMTVQVNKLASGDATLAKLLFKAYRGLFVVGSISPDPHACRQMEEVLARGYGAVVARYFRQASLSGLMRPGQPVPVVLDLDDRDDLTISAHLARLFGRGALHGLTERLIVRRLRAYLDRCLPNAAHVFVTSEDEAAGLGIEHLTVLPNIPFSLPAPGAADLGPAAEKVVTFVGTHGHTPNMNGVDRFLRESWPRIRERHPDARFQLVGVGGWEQKAELYRDVEGLEIVGFVEEIADAYGAARVGVCPVFEGGGTKIKVLEGLMFGVPMVVTAHSARGFTREVRESLSIAEDSDSFADRVADLLDDPERARAMGAAGRAAVEAGYTRPVFFETVRRTLRPLIGRTEAAAAAR